MREDGDDDQQTESESEEELVDNKKRWCLPTYEIDTNDIMYLFP